MQATTKPTAHFIHIPKTGGTAIAHALEAAKDIGRYHLEIHNHHFTLADVQPDQKAFFFLRDPVKRFTSAFFSRQRQGRPRYNVPWRPLEAEAFATFETPNALGEALSSSDEALKTAAGAAMRNVAHIQSFYSRWFTSEDYFRSRLDSILYIGFQESLDADFERIKAKLGLPKDLALPDDETTAHRNPSSVDKRLSDLAVANLRAWYAADYSFLAMCRELAQTVNA